MKCQNKDYTILVFKDFNEGKKFFSVFGKNNKLIESKFFNDEYNSYLEGDEIYVVWPIWTPTEKVDIITWEKISYIPDFWNNQTEEK